jgi:hypothetical protein
MDMAFRYVIVPRQHLYWIEEVSAGGSRRRIECFQYEGPAVERLRVLQLQRDEMEQRLREREASRGI